MKLLKAHITNFRSIEDSNEFEIGDLTCLVGKNEAGKTAILQALYGLNPMGYFAYDKTRDYPRRHLNRFDDRHSDGKSEVIETFWLLSEENKELIIERYGINALENDEITISKYIGCNHQYWSIPCDSEACLKHLIHKFALDELEKKQLKDAKNAEEAVMALSSLPQLSENLQNLLDELNGLSETDFHAAMIDILSPMMPKFFYTSHFYRMSGEISINKISGDIQQHRVTISDQIFLDFLEYAGTSIEDLKGATKRQDLNARCEEASNEITDEIFQFWSQNEALKVNIVIGEGRPDDPPPFNGGTVVEISIYNNHHRVSVPLSERSAGFIWFFSFLSQFKQLKKTAGNAIILLDEPGLTLHGKAQSDLLRYIEERLLPEHQVIFTTHSPFMIPAERMVDVRIVEDVIKYDKNKPVVLGTKVSSDVLSVDKDTLFPLQGALGYEITQSLFIGKNTLLVEGPSDILYLQAFSAALKSRQREGLDTHWVICPSGGIDKILPFASLFGGNDINIAVLCDLATGDKGKIERLRNSQILKASQLFTAADFTNKSESDIEDFLHPELFVKLLNSAYELSGENRLSIEKLNAAVPSTERIVKKAEVIFNLMPSDVQNFDHFHPSDWLIRNSAFLVDSVELDETLNRFEQAFKAINDVLKC
ncbi:AAA family ATPase [Methylovulum psychrotolerans]|uniref:ATP-dependent endonuclease n=1 Tax=Methylovulum psychrotolerans TaxID=1704499 RepID=A0A1Z4BY49_9GAMM|nr:AAA family ATPase [Methylovulum psychrotolerans]ASF46227.1 ATP-dependent endonuclease [Methylovulum psychrotolerans]